MTVDITQNTVKATASGAAGETVTVPFLFFANADLEVYIEDQTTGATTVLTLDTDYSVTGAGVSTGGTVTMITTQTAGDFIHADRWMDLLQGENYRETGKFPAASHETALDKLVMMQQQIAGRMGGVDHDPGFTEFMSRLSTNVNQWDAQSTIIAAVLDPTAAQHAATKAYVDSQITGAGNMPAPADPSEDDYILVAGSGTATWQDFKIPSPVSGDDESVLEATGSGAGGFAWGVRPLRNYLINGGFDVSQRGTSWTAATDPLNSDDTYLIDRWLLLSDGNDIVDVSQEATVIPAGAFASLKAEVETANKKFGFLTILEQRDAAQLIGKTVSLSFDLRTESSTRIENVRAVVLAWDGTADAVTSDVVSAWAVEGTNPTFATNWTAENTAANLAVSQGSFTRHKIEGISIDTSGAKNIAIFIWVDDTDGSVNDLLYIGNVQLEISATAHRFMGRNFQEELALCQRYYAKTFDQSVRPAQNLSDANGALFEISAGTGGGAVSEVWAFPVPMRAVPTITTYNTDAANSSWWRNADTTSVAAGTQALGDRSVVIENTGATNSLIQHRIHAAADAEL